MNLFVSCVGEVVSFFAQLSTFRIQSMDDKGMGKDMMRHPENTKKNTGPPNHWVSTSKWTIFHWVFGSVTHRIFVGHSKKIQKIWVVSLVSLQQGVNNLFNLMQGIPLSFTIYGYRVFRQGPRYYHYKPNTREVVSKIFKEMIQFHSIWAVLSDEQMSNG